MAACSRAARTRAAPANTWAEDVAEIDVGDAESYCGNRWCCFPTLPGAETLEIARTLTGAAARSAGEACQQMRHHQAGDTDHGASPRRIARVERDARAVLGLLKRSDPPIFPDATAAWAAGRAGAAAATSSPTGAAAGTGG